MKNSNKDYDIENLIKNIRWLEKHIERLKNELPLITIKSKKGYTLYKDRGTLKSVLEKAVKERVDLCGVFLKGANLCGANLQGACLKGANFCGSNLQCANLCKASLECADLIKANLQDADFSYTSLEGVNLHEANIEGTDFSYATFTILPKIKNVKYEEFRRNMYLKDAKEYYNERFYRGS